VLLPVGYYFQPHVNSTSCYFQPSITSSRMLFPTSCYFEPRSASSLMVLKASCYFQSLVTYNLVLLLASCYFFKFLPKHSSQHLVTNVLKTSHLLPYNVINKQSQNAIVSDTQSTTVARKRAIHVAANNASIAQ
jgi:hypothetical protein